MNMRRRDFPAVIGLTLVGSAVVAKSEPVVDAAHANDGLTFAAEAIHQDVEFGVPPAKVYETLLDTASFDAVTRLGEASRSGKIGKTPTAIERGLGGHFTIFGGYIEGRQIEHVSGKRIVQAWREEIWPEGVFSIVRFDLRAAAAGTQLSFDHAGFPKGAGPHLASGWYGNYWNPMKAYFGKHAT